LLRVAGRKVLRRVLEFLDDVAQRALRGTPQDRNDEVRQVLSGRLRPVGPVALQEDLEFLAAVVAVDVVRATGRQKDPAGAQRRRQAFLPRRTGIYRRGVEEHGFVRQQMLLQVQSLAKMADESVEALAAVVAGVAEETLEWHVVRSPASLGGICR